ncbi:MAG: hypothetical protein NTY12_03855 [Candidatus Falkowbacteria bacterium]|nr:hypothetical protein [Candidatus Falkowbacteria bacterium]
MSEKEKILEPSIEKPLANQPIRPEAPSAPEQKIESGNKATDEKAGDFLATPAAQTQTANALTPEVERVAEIERILEDDLSNVYFNLPEVEKEKFRLQGEETAIEINTLLSSTKIKVQKIIKLIRNWLLLIPGVNRFFLEQEAKLKTDEIIKIKDNF